MYVNRDIHLGFYVYNKDDAKNPTLVWGTIKKRALLALRLFCSNAVFTGIRR